MSMFSGFFRPRRIIFLNTRKVDDEKLAADMSRVFGDMSRVFDDMAKVMHDADKRGDK